jgi:protein gp37
VAEQTGIEWCDATFNPWWGCERVSPGCAHCYADTLATRYGFGETWGDGHGFRFFGDKHWDEPLKWARLLPGKLGRRPRVFCASMADVFEEREELSAERVRLFDLILRTPELDWLVLTKRPEFARDWLADEHWRGSIASFYAYNFDDGDAAWDHAQSEITRGPRNVWMGTSIENARFTWRADVLREIPAAVRFIRAEPLLGSLYDDGRRDADTDVQDLTRSSALGSARDADSRGSDASGLGSGRASVRTVRQLPERLVERHAHRAPLDLAGIDWVIVGGESGPKARPFHLEPVAGRHQAEPIVASRLVPMAVRRCL